MPKSVGADELLKAAMQKFAAHDRYFNSAALWTLRYPDGSEVCSLPETDEPFQLAKYKEQLMKDYQKIVLYIAPGMAS